MNLSPFAETLRPVDVLNALIARHGVFRVFLAFPAALIKQRRERMLSGQYLSAHLSRDIGLPPEGTRYRDYS